MMSENGGKTIAELNNKFSNSDPEVVLKKLSETYPQQVVFSSSFGLEDQVITDIISTSGVTVEVFTIDTGRLFPETYKTWQRTLEKYNISIKVYYPEPALLEEMLGRKGPFSFYESVENRLECCHIRKVLPLQRALQGKKVWVTGLRAEQSENRKNLSLFQWDSVHQVIKYNPLLTWSTEDVRRFISSRNVPYNSLHDKGFPSIGCQPCTRAIREGENFRAGRWWWENNSSKECGLHPVSS